MKNFKPLLIALFCSLLLVGLSFAQGPGPGGPMHGHGMHGQRMMGKKMGPGMNLPGLTDKQKAAIKKLHVAQMQSTQAIRNQIMEKKAHLHTLQTADKPNMRAINAAIDEISALKTKIAKKRAETHQKIRALLTPEQRVMFDNRPMGKKGGHGPGMRNKCPNCQRR